MNQAFSVQLTPNMVTEHATADDDPVREPPDAAVVFGALCRVGAGAMDTAYGKYTGSYCLSPRTRWR
jgi:hypothetical protein